MIDQAKSLNDLILSKKRPPSQAVKQQANKA